MHLLLIGSHDVTDSQLTLCRNDSLSSVNLPPETHFPFPFFRNTLLQIWLDAQGAKCVDGRKHKSLHY